MQIQRFTFGPFETNTYVLSFPSGRDGVGPHILLIDPACSNEYEQQQLAQYIDSVSEAVCQYNGLSAKRSVSKAVCQRSGLSAAGGLTILATHGHLDHLWGAKWATDRWNVPVLMPEADIPMAKAMQAQYDLFGIRATPQPFPIESLSAALPQSVSNAFRQPEGRSVSNAVCQRSGLSLISTPGHTPGSVCLYWPEEKVLLSGDTLFRGGYGRTDLPGGDTAQLISSLQHLATLPPETQVFPGHGEATTIGSELR